MLGPRGAAWRLPGWLAPGCGGAAGGATYSRLASEADSVEEADIYLVLSFAAGRLPSDDKACQAKEVLQWIISDEEFFKRTPEKPSAQTSSREGAADGHCAATPAAPVEGRPRRRRGARPSPPGLCSADGPASDSGSDGSASEDEELAGLYAAAQECSTHGELREKVLHLVLRTLGARPCALRARAFASSPAAAPEPQRVLLHVAISAAEDVLKAHAAQLNVQVPLDEAVVLELLRRKFKPDEVPPVYVAYDREIEAKWASVGSKAVSGTTSPFASAPRPGTGPDGSIFRPVDRIRIVDQVIARVFDLDGMVRAGFLESYYWCHHHAARTSLKANWASGWSSLVAGPLVDRTLSDAREYFGEKLAFRLCFFQAVHKWLLPVALLAPLLECFFSRDVAAWLLAFCLPVGAAMFRKCWAGQEEYWRIIWGMEDFQVSEAQRPGFRGHWVESPVDRHSSVKTANPNEQRLRSAFTTLCTALAYATAAAFGAGVTFARAWLVRAQQRTWAQALAFGAAIQILVLSSLWDKLALWLTEFDNHETQSSFEEAMIRRIFRFRCINTFGTLFYTIFVKRYVEGCEKSLLGTGCRGELRTNLLAIFVTSFGASLMGYLKPRIALWYRECRRTSARAAPGYEEAQHGLGRYEMHAEILDVMEPLMGLGFVLFFGSVAPEIFPLYFLSSLLHLRAWGWRLLHAHQRPYPSGAFGVGRWTGIIDGFVASSLSVNCALAVLQGVKGASLGDLDDALDALPLPDVDLQALLQPEGMLRCANEGGLMMYDWRLLLILYVVVERCLQQVVRAFHYAIGGRTVCKVLRKRRETVVTLFRSLVFALAEGHAPQLAQRGRALRRAVPEAMDILTLEAPDPASPASWQPAAGGKRRRDACKALARNVVTGMPPLELAAPRWRDGDALFRPARLDGGGGDAPRRGLCCGGGGSGIMDDEDALEGDALIKL